MLTLQAAIGQRVRHRRMERHLLQKDFAALVGWQPDYVSRFEKGRWTQIDPERFCAVIRTLGMSADELLGLSLREEDAS